MASLSIICKTSLNSIGRIKNYLAEEKLGAFLILTKLNRQYVSGFTGSAGVVLVSAHAARLFVDERYLIRARRESGLVVKNLNQLAPALSGFRKIGVEDQITLRELRWLRKIGRGFHPTHDVVETLRAVKSAAEIASIRKGQGVIDRIFRRLKKFVKPGLAETAVALEIERLAKKFGAQGLAFDSIVAFGANAAAPHHFPGGQKLRRNNFLLLDFGVLVNGYHSDFTRTLFLGNPSKKQTAVYEAVRQAQLSGIAAARVGAKASAVDAAARGFITERGYGRYFTHNTGHGVGIEIHELPNFSKNSEDILQRDMIVTVEPGIYLENWGGVRIEDMVWVQQEPRVLSAIPKALSSMIIK